MIKVLVLKKDNLISSIRVNGHANYNEFGKDIVCAAVSTLVCTLDSYLSNLNLAKSIYEVKTDSNYDGIDENFDIEFRFNQSFFKDLKADAGIKFFLTGIKDISDSYSDYVNLEIQEEQNDKI
ncbi:MAG: ribosomal-processing cysteine protease Prp [Tissierellia bacterium]|nr:ribosomal-processing cysteine protease Prp [Tissierellia bacterium]